MSKRDSKIELRCAIGPVRPVGNEEAEVPKVESFCYIARYKELGLKMIVLEVVFPHLLESRQTLKPPVRG